MTTYLPRSLSPQERITARSEVDANGCWLWTGSVNNCGYGNFRYDGTPMGAHRASYLIFVGPIPTGMSIDHLCRVRRCVNPAHLEPVTQRLNVLRGIAPTAVHGAKTHCIHGHEFTAENTRHHGPDGRWRQCRACRASYRARQGALKSTA